MKAFALILALTIAAPLSFAALDCRTLIAQKSKTRALALESTAGYEWFKAFLEFDARRQGIDAAVWRRMTASRRVVLLEELGVQPRALLDFAASLCVSGLVGTASAMDAAGLDVTDPEYIPDASMIQYGLGAQISNVLGKLKALKITDIRWTDGQSRREGSTVYLRPPGDLLPDPSEGVAQLLPKLAYALEPSVFDNPIFETGAATLDEYLALNLVRKAQSERERMMAGTRVLRSLFGAGVISEQSTFPDDEDFNFVQFGEGTKRWEILGKEESREAALFEIRDWPLGSIRLEDVWRSQLTTQFRAQPRSSLPPASPVSVTKAATPVQTVDWVREHVGFDVPSKLFGYSVGDNKVRQDLTMKVEELDAPHAPNTFRITVADPDGKLVLQLDWWKREDVGLQVGPKFLRLDDDFQFLEEVVNVRSELPELGAKILQLATAAMILRAHPPASVRKTEVEILNIFRQTYSMFLKEGIIKRLYIRRKTLSLSGYGPPVFRVSGYFKTDSLDPNGIITVVENGGDDGRVNRLTAFASSFAMPVPITTISLTDTGRIAVWFSRNLIRVPNDNRAIGYSWSAPGPAAEVQLSKHDEGVQVDLRGVGNVAKLHRFSLGEEFNPAWLALRHTVQHLFLAADAAVPALSEENSSASRLVGRARPIRVDDSNWSDQWKALVERIQQ